MLFCSSQRFIRSLKPQVANGGLRAELQAIPSSCEWDPDARDDEFNVSESEDSALLIRAVFRLVFIVTPFSSIDLSEELEPK